jgi:RNA polymerase sigma-70 factor, ECF subfamily
MSDRSQSEELDCAASDVRASASNALHTVSSVSLVTDDELLRRIRAGEREFYYDLVAPHERKAFVIALSILRNETDAEDCVQDAVLKALRHLDQFRGECKFGTWLIGIVMNEAKMRLRKLRTGLHESLDTTLTDYDGNYVPTVFGDWREVPSEALERKEMRDVLKRAVESLKDIYRDVFVLRDVEGHDVATTAQILGVSQETVKTRLLRARLQLRDLLAPIFKKGFALAREPFKKGRNPWR